MVPQKQAALDAAPPINIKMSGRDLLGIAELLVSTTSLDDFLKKISQSAEDLLESEASSVMLLSDDKKSLFCKVASGKASQVLRKVVLPVGSGIVGWVAANGKPDIVVDASADKRFAASIDKSSGFVTRSLIGVPIIFRGEILGVLEVLNRRSGGPYTQEHVLLLTGLANLASSAIATARSTLEQQNFFSHILELLGGMVESIKPDMQAHSVRCVKLACAIGKVMELDDYDYRMLYYAGYLHDIGYLGLNNPKAAARLGFSQMNEEQHPLASVKMLDGIKVLVGALPIIQNHHEAYDGSGFPGKIKGEDIPLGARILFLVESLEELRMKNGLKGDELLQRAITQAKEGAGKRFDPTVVPVAVEILQNYKELW